MTQDKRAEHLAREAIMNLLSNEEIARVSTAETAVQMVETAEYIDLEHLDLGVQHATAATKVDMGNVLPRSAVQDVTWCKILSELGTGAPAKGEWRSNSVSTS